MNGEKRESRMPGETDVRCARIFVILNPSAGSYLSEAVEAALERRFPGDDPSAYEVHIVREHEKLTELASAAVSRGAQIVVAAGGDGTVSAVAEVLVGTEVSLGIIPLGTANVLARELGIPVAIDEACALFAGDIGIITVDAIAVRSGYYFTQVGVGIDALMIRDTSREIKKRFGRIAYIWTALKSLVGFQPRRFELTVDGKVIKARASQLVLANCGTLGQQPLRWGPRIRPNDGRIDVCIIRARNLLDYAVLAWHVLLHRHRRIRNFRYLAAEREVRVRTRRPLPVQADGEIIGETPIEARVAAAALKVVVDRDFAPAESGWWLLPLSFRPASSK
jgi:YegS/Rv2252/BmrU family lipid kinase